MPKKIFNKRGYFAIDFDSDSLGYKWVKITFAKRGRLGKLLKIRSQRIVRNLKGMKVIRIENNKPKVSSVTITYKKI